MGCAEVSDNFTFAQLSTGNDPRLVARCCRCKKVRTLKGIPQPTSLCPVGDYTAAVLCRREIRIIDLNEGAFKVSSAKRNPLIELNFALCSFFGAFRSH